MGVNSEANATPKDTVIDAAQEPAVKSWAPKADSAAIDTIDFSDFLSGDAARIQCCLTLIRKACIENGFFQITNHSVSPYLLKRIMKASQDFFSLPQEEKNKLDQRQNDHNRGYQMILSQKYKDEDTAPDLKEGYYVGPELPWDHYSVKAGHFAHGPNYWPESLGESFQDTCMEYLEQMNTLAIQVLRAVSLSIDGSVQETDEFINKFTKNPICYYKFNHYPKPKSLDIGQKGHGEHKDFGFITLLLQDENPGLEVWHARSDSWIEVPPTKNAFVINCGNLLERWTNETYNSNVHRVLNHSGTDRHSIAHLYHVSLKWAKQWCRCTACKYHELTIIQGNPDYVIHPRQSCINNQLGTPFKPIRIEDFVRGKYDEVYARADFLAKKEADAEEKGEASE